MKIIATDRKGAEHVIEGRDGWSVMEILRDAGLPVAAECGGAFLNTSATNMAKSE